MAAGRREEVVERGRVLAASDRPEKGVADARAAVGRGPVGRHHQTRGPAVLLDREVHPRQKEHRHALDLDDRVAQQHVVVEVDVDRRRDDLPAGGRLHAARERAPGEPVAARADPLDLLAEEEHVGLLRPEHALVDLAAHVHRPVRVLEDRGAVGHVEIDLLGGDAHLGRHEDDVAAGRDPRRPGIEEGLLREKLPALILAAELDVVDE